MTGLIHATGLHAELGGSLVLKNADLLLDQGQFLAVIGPNGAGKSSLLRAVLRLLPIQSGRIEICGQDVSGLAPQKLSHFLSYIPQGHIAHWPLDVETLVALGRRQKHHVFEKLRDEDHDAIEKALRAVGLQAFRKRPLSTLSGGEKARAFIARALASQARILMVDEPVAALDPRHQLQVMGLLKDLCSDHDIGVVSVLHELHLATRYCDAFLLVNEGMTQLIGYGELPSNVDTIERVFGIKVQNLPQGGYGAVGFR